MEYQSREYALQQENEILRKNVADLQEQVHNGYMRIIALGENKFANPEERLQIITK